MILTPSSPAKYFLFITLAHPSHLAHNHCPASGPTKSRQGQPGAFFPNIIDNRDLWWYAVPLLRIACVLL